MEKEKDSGKKSINDPNLGDRRYSPTEFMRARRPYLFSDSQEEDEYKITKDVFDHYLQTLTNRKQEIVFEHFCRKLAEKEICPNLLPQTGPTGGGDSKVDSETYPVSDAISLRWYEGIGREASNARWAFAFSAKKTWKSKVKSDVKKIVETERNYKLIFFISNQYIRDKDRANIEDELRNQHKVDIRILDRTWILKMVFEHKLIPLAIETLNIPGYDMITKKKAGPHDVERETELVSLESQIADQDRYKGVEYQLGEDCLRASILARGLEYSRVDVDGRFLRAERIAEKFNHGQQLMRILYNRAWTAYWWYEDYEELNTLYDRVEDLAIDSIVAYDLELLKNLWTLLFTSVRKGDLDEKSSKLEERSLRLKSSLEKLMSEKSRPNNSLQARTNLVLMELIEAITSGKPLDDCFNNLKDIFQKSRGLIEFSVESISQIIKELGVVVTNNVFYDELLDLVINEIKNRTSDGEAGKILLERGYQVLRAGKNYEAIKILGRAQLLLAKDEYEDAWIASLVGCGLAYESTGLLWAARANLLVGANRTLSEFWKYGKITKRALRCIQKLVWLELQLGRIFPALEYIELASVLAGQLMLESDEKKEYDEERTNQDIVLGILFLKTDLWDSKTLDFLPDILENLGLFNSRMALLYVLGYEGLLREEQSIPESESAEDVNELFKKALNQPANKDLPLLTELGFKSKITFKTYVLGCEICVELENTHTSIFLAETILSTFEALLSTGLDRSVGIVPFRSELRILINPSDFVKTIPEYEITDDENGLVIDLKHLDQTPLIPASEQNNFGEWLFKFILNVTLKTVWIHDFEAFKSKIEKEEMFARAFYNVGISVAIENILGSNPKQSLSDWEKIPVKNKFPLHRDLHWNNMNKKEDVVNLEEKVEWGKGNPPDDLLFGIDNMKHSEMRSFSLINPYLWDKAQWRGFSSVYFEDMLFLALGFVNAEPAINIFKGWRKKIGKVDSNELLRISIITGFNSEIPHSYRVLVSSNIPKSFSARYFTSMSRIHQMTPQNPDAISNTSQLFKKLGKYYLIPGQMEQSNKTSIKLFYEFGIEKTELNIIPAWQIGSNDPDVFGIKENDKPIIPEEITDAPVISALNRFTKYKNRK